MTTRKIACLSLVAALTASTGLAATGTKGRSPAPGTYITIPDTIVAGDEPGLRADVERGLFFVPENRANPNSRMIAVAFIRFPALQATGTGRPLPPDGGRHFNLGIGLRACSAPQFPAGQCHLA